MATYRFNNASLVDEVTVHRTEGGGVRAYLHARAGAGADAIDTLKKSLTSHALQLTPIQEDGKPALEVRGFGKHESTLLQLLDKNGATAGSPTLEHTADDKISVKDKLRKNTLNLSGLSYLVGDVSYLSYGLRESIDAKKPQSALAGVFYALGSPFLVFFGRNDKSDLQLKHMSYNLIKDLQNEHIVIPKDAAVRNVANGHNATRWKKIKNFCERYPAEITNMIFAGAGSMIMWEKIDELKKLEWHPIKDYKAGGLKGVMNFLKKEEKIAGKAQHAKGSLLMDIGLGSMTVAAGLISVLIEEEAPKKDEPKKTGIAGLMQKIRQRPLAAASATLMAATAAHAGSTYVDWKHAKSVDRSGINAEELAQITRLEGSLIRRGVFVASNVVAEALMGVSSKGHGAGVKSDKSLEHSAYAVAADLIEREAPPNREALLERVSTFYAHKKHLASDPKIIKEGIRKEMAAMQLNPWTSIAAASPSPVPQKMPGDEHFWRNRTMTSQQMAAESPAI